MSYHRFTNLREMFNGDLTCKLNRNVESLNFKTLPCNCRDHATTGCNYGDACRDSIVVYQALCKETGKSYIGCTQQHLKTRMQQHLQEVKQRKRGKGSFDSFAAHFDMVTLNFPKPSSRLLRNLMEITILWKGNPLSTVKTFGTNRCILCDKERIHIFKWMRTKPDLLINSCNELYGACRHKPKFHRFATALSSSTDESSMDEKVPVTTDV